MSKPTCSLDGCSQPVIARGMCRRHYARWYKTGDPGPVGLKRLPDHAPCSVDGCDKPNCANGLCEMHRWRMRAKGDPGPVGHLHRGRTAQPDVKCKVDECYRITRGGRDGYCRLHSARLERGLELGPAEPLRAPRGSGSSHDGYRRIYVPDGRRVMEHVYVMEHHLGRELVPGENVHHRNGHRSDNRLENLELWLVMQPSGQRVEDLIAYVAGFFPDEVQKAIANRSE
jgi:hypothetical protein